MGGLCCSSNLVKRIKVLYVLLYAGLTGGKMSMESRIRLTRFRGTAVSKSRPGTLVAVGEKLK
jgi:hypothetical protein